MMQLIIINCQIFGHSTDHEYFFALKSISPLQSRCQHLVLQLLFCR